MVADGFEGLMWTARRDIPAQQRLSGRTYAFRSRKFCPSSNWSRTPSGPGSRGQQTRLLVWC